MSKRNTQEAKRAARERLRAERERQAKKDKMRRQLVVAASIVGVLAIAAGVGFAVTNMNDSSGGKVSSKDWTAAAKDKKLVKPANTSGKDGTTVVIGDEKAEKTLEVYEDMRCPACASFEQTTGDLMMKDIENGAYKASFTMAAFIDEMAPGSGSKNSLSALGAALDVSPEAFLEYKHTLYSKENHPEESDDKFSDDSYLLEVSDQVKELKDNKEFEKAVKDGTYDKWAQAMAKKFESAKDVQGTPTFKMDGEKLVVEGTENTPMTPDQFQAAVAKALEK
ncbi:MULTISPECIES: thioredoxin domain-containing protein [Streptomyces]|uniref:Thioredoxin domain-containing protein n=1 Tax=Streptomyces lycii TaxID=2654337 RepID=A0ABQ7FR65_9ACTN|nr:MULTISPECIES: thioredoxin domain-containing protein [Streptomyces]KAF4410194.1 thioredoxin domain-containing protein [Streptomyces lycii]PGH50831.1 disulfide bond formation protein DsbA [Streptomyces sp. Ru87]